MCCSFFALFKLQEEGARKKSSVEVIARIILSFAARELKIKKNAQAKNLADSLSCCLALDASSPKQRGAI
jgi:hypothetical protein